MIGGVEEACTAGRGFNSGGEVMLKVFGGALAWTVGSMAVEPVVREESESWFFVVNFRRRW